jgi:hypothetical protein
MLETEAGEAVWSVADEDRVLQAGRALVVNALVHTPPGSRVLVTARRRGARAELAVEDDGPGIPDRHRDAVFERFYRVEGGKASGSGLGLAIARELARLMGGIVRLESRPGRTVFTLDLPGGSAPRAWTAVTAFSRENGDGGAGAGRGRSGWSISGRSPSPDDVHEQPRAFAWRQRRPGSSAACRRATRW